MRIPHGISIPNKSASQLMSDALILALIIVGLIVLDVSAYFYGYDSREGLRPHDFDHS